MTWLTLAMSPLTFAFLVANVRGWRASPPRPLVVLLVLDALAMCVGLVCALAASFQRWPGP